MSSTSPEIWQSTSNPIHICARASITFTLARMLTRFLVWLCGVSPGPRRALWRWWYNKLAKEIGQAEWTFMNYGFRPANGEGELELRAEDEGDRFCIQLYERVTGGVELGGKDTLEIGSGRGGGASYLARYRGPRLITGVDYSAEAIAFCERRHAGIGNLQFSRGDAERLEQPDHSVDVVVNVESSHCYGNIRMFFNEVARTLRPGGHFLFADLRGAAEMEELKQALRETSRFEIIREENISAGVVAAMEADDKRKRQMIERLVPQTIRPLFREFAGRQGGQVFEGLKSQRLVYWRFVIRRI
ncbi:MAG TPA: class I SAM-dependent methyltransferase [Verrucomicrobiae bacterium]|nr:class I SAM-dependent methyltransferase [Verrucomicrobiae bacterium]